MNVFFALKNHLTFILIYDIDSLAIKNLLDLLQALTYEDVLAKLISVDIYTP